MYIRVKICGYQQSAPNKFIVDLIPHYHHTIENFLNRVIQLCSLNLDVASLQIYDQGFILPHQLRSSYLNDQKTYSIFVKSPSSKKQRKNRKRIEKESLRKSMSIESEQSHSYTILDKEASPPELSKFKKAMQEKSNSSSSPPPKKFLPSEDQKKVVRQISDSSSSSSLVPVPAKKIKSNKQKKIKQASSSSSSSSLPKIPQNKVGVIKETKKAEISVPKKINYAKKIQSSSQSDSWGDSSSSEPKKPLPQAVVKPIIESKLRPESEMKPNITKQIAGTQNSQKRMIVKKKIVGDSDSESSDSSIKNMKKQVPKTVPISVRNKNKQQQRSAEENTMSRFQQNQEAQWLPITKSILEGWEKNHEPFSLIMEGNEIRFKIMDLDEEKFIPVLSGWISGEVAEVRGEGQQKIVKIANCNKIGANGQNQFMKTYEMPVMNIQELQIKRITFKELQKQLEEHRQVADEKGGRRSEIESNLGKQEEKPVQSLEDFICGQISYYFSEKNYPVDLFMQMHANRDSQGYIASSLFLNFQKVKSKLKSEQKLWAFLTSDEKIKSRNYELDLDRRMIRKKNLKIDEARQQQDQ